MFNQHYRAKASTGKPQRIKAWTKRKRKVARSANERKLAQTDRKDGAGDDTGDSVSKAELSTNPSVDEVSSSKCDEGQWASLYLEDQHLAEAVAFFTFKNTVQELDKATKKLADCVSWTRMAGG